MTNRGAAPRTPSGQRLVRNPDGGQPPGDLPGPFFGKQGDEQRDPTAGEKEALARVQRELPQDGEPDGHESSRTTGDTPAEGVDPCGVRPTSARRKLRDIVRSGDRNEAPR